MTTISRRRAIAALLLNILVWPGLGSLVARQSVGWIQGTLALFLIVILVGVAANGGMSAGAGVLGLGLFAIWVWGILTAARVLMDVGTAHPP